MNIYDKFFELCNIKSDINEHLPKLKEISEKYNHITEFGVRNIVSTWALLAGKPKTLISYDINNIDSKPIQNLAKLEGINFMFHQKNTCSIIIDETDVLFIDTLHTYKQLKTELSIHHSNVKHCIVMHDTYTFGIKDMEDCYNLGGPYVNINENTYGLQSAINEFLFEHKNWNKTYETSINNGLTIIERI